MCSLPGGRYSRYSYLELATWKDFNMSLLWTNRPFLFSFSTQNIFMFGKKWKLIILRSATTASGMVYEQKKNGHTNKDKPFQEFKDFKIIFI